jgi:hypothetical protein
VRTVRHPPDVVFIEACQPLSVTARAMLAALVFERFCVENDIDTPAIDAFLRHHWAYLDVLVGSTEFADWEHAKPGLYDNLSSRPALESRCGNLLEAVETTLCHSFHAAADDPATYRSLRAVVDTARVSPLPPVTPFKFSRLADGGGWGKDLTPADAAYWHSLRQTYARALRT